MRTDSSRGFLDSVLALSALSFVLIACHPSVSVVAVDDSAYRGMWDRNWAAITTDIALLAPSGSSPGVCNAGGNKQECYDTSKALLADFRVFAQDLEQVDIPDEYANATATLQRAVAEEIAGFQLRMRAISRGDDSAWTDANESLRQGSLHIQQAYGEFPSAVRPSSPPPL
jgi:hypothetical protein